METGWLICVGDPFSGLTLYGAPDGLPFDDQKEAIAVAELTFTNEMWCIAGVRRTPALKELN
jgi:hypothetical protein